MDRAHPTHLATFLLESHHYMDGTLNHNDQQLLLT